MRLHLFLALAAAAPLAAQAPATLPAFQVEDQFKRKHTEQEWAGAPGVFLVTNREGRTSLMRWYQAFLGSAPAGTRVAMAADTKGAPFFVKGAIRGSMPKDTLLPILIDYSGKLARPLRGTDTLAAVYYGADGRLIARRPLPTGTEPAPDDAALVTELLGAAP